MPAHARPRQTGHVYPLVSLATHPAPKCRLDSETAEDNTSPFEHTMNRGFTTDTYKVSYHGYAHSHIDALCHILYKDQTYNGYPRGEINIRKTARQV